MEVTFVIFIFLIYLCTMKSIFDKINDKDARVFMLSAYRTCRQHGFKYIKAFRVIMLACYRCNDGRWCDLENYSINCTRAYYNLNGINLAQRFLNLYNNSLKFYKERKEDNII